MSHTPHEIAEEFPDERGVLQELMATDAHFAKILDDYHAVNRAIHRGETNVEPMADLYLEELKKRRLAMLDLISGRLRETA